MGKVKDILIEAEELGIEVTEGMDIQSVQTEIDLAKAQAEYNKLLTELSLMLGRIVKDQKQSLDKLTALIDGIKGATKDAK